MLLNSGNIKDLAPTFVENYTDENVSKAVYQNYHNRIKEYKKIMGIGSKYFHGHLHDSRIISCKNNKGDLYLKLNEMATLQFACALIDKMKLKINISKMIFPLEIISENTNHLSLNTVDVSGKLDEIKFVALNEYLYEEIIEWTDGKIKIAFDLWANRIRHNYNRYLLLLSCENVIINERQRIYWNKYFGDKYDKYYNVFLEERNKGECLADYSLCEKLIDKLWQTNIIKEI